jgi:hypothetical protein
MAISSDYETVEPNIYGYTLTETANLIKTGSCNTTKKNPTKFIQSQGLNGIWTFTLISQIYNYYLLLVEEYSQVTQVPLNTQFNNYNEKRIYVTNNLINIFLLVLQCYCLQLLLVISAIGLAIVLGFCLFIVWLCIASVLILINVLVTTFNMIAWWYTVVSITIAIAPLVLILIGCILYHILLVGILLSIVVSYIGGLFLILGCTFITYLELNYNFCKNMIYCIKVVVTFLVFSLCISICGTLLCLYSTILSCYWILYCVILFVFAYDVKKEQEIIITEV